MVGRSALIGWQAWRRGASRVPLAKKADETRAIGCCSLGTVMCDGRRRHRRLPSNTNTWRQGICSARHQGRNRRRSAGRRAKSVPVTPLRAIRRAGPLPGQSIERRTVRDNANRPGVRPAADAARSLNKYDRLTDQTLALIARVRPSPLARAKSPQRTDRAKALRPPP
jgi:hypothetical protein